MKRKVSAIFVCLLICNSCLYASINILIYGDYSDKEAITLSQINGLNITHTESLTDITQANLSNFDVFYAGTSYHHDLDLKATIIQDYLHGGGGVVVGQSNVEGPISWLPTNLSVNVDSLWYPGHYNFPYSAPGGSGFTRTPEGQTHPMLSGLQTSDLGAGPADTIFRNSLAPTWDVLSVYTSDPDIVGIAVNYYGSGRVVLWPEYLGTSFSNQIPSDACIQQVFEWVAIPEPATLSLVALGLLSVLRRRK